MLTIPVRINIKTRITMLILLTFIGMSGVYILSSHYISESLFNARFEQTHKLVKEAYSVIRTIETEGIERGETNEKIRQRALRYLREMSLNDNEYYWVIDRGGNVILHYYSSIDKKPFEKLGNGKTKKIIEKLLAYIKNKTEGSVLYDWPPDENSKAKVGYIKEYENWGWLIGRGDHVEDIQYQIAGVKKKLALMVLLATGIAFLIAYLVGRSISRPIESLNKTMQKLSEGDYYVQINELNRRDEIGSMAQTINLLLENSRRIAMLEHEQKGADSLKSEFVSVVSHELRTPLTSIRGSLGLIAGGAVGEIPEKVKGLITIAHNSCERLILLINDILDMDKITSGDMPFQFKPESLNALLRKAIESNKGYAEKYLVRYDFKPLENDLKIYVDDARFQQVILNLLSNAVKFSASGSKVDIWMEVKERMVRIFVKVHGLGIPQEFRMRMFKKFSQSDTSSTRKRGGTGLGLYITKQIIERMKGQIGYDSIVGLGTTFWVEFPIAESAAAIPITFPARENIHANILELVR